MISLIRSNTEEVKYRFLVGGGKNINENSNKDFIHQKMCTRINCG